MCLTMKLIEFLKLFSRNKEWCMSASITLEPMDLQEDCGFIREF